MIRPPSRLPRCLVAAAIFAWMTLASRPAAADTVTLAGSSIPLRGCRIIEIRRGHVTFSDASDRRQRLPLDQVAALGFEGLPALDAAEALLADDDALPALGRLLDAAVGANNASQRLWVHARLSRTHDGLGQFVQAAGHAAEVFLLEDDPSWSRLVPLSEPDTPTYAAAAEAMHHLLEAQKRVKNALLARAISDMIGRVRPIHESLKAHYAGPPIRPGTTVSGFDREQIRLRGGSALAAAHASGRPPAPAPADRPPRVSSPGSTSEAPARQDDTTSLLPRDRSPETIDQLLSMGRPSEALAVCEQVAAALDDRNVPRFLHQYGLALVAVGRETDAAMMFLRCAAQEPAGAAAAPSLLEAAAILHRAYHNPAAARRLLLRAEETATRLGQEDLAAQARETLHSLSAPSSDHASSR